MNIQTLIRMVSSVDAIAGDYLEKIVPTLGSYRGLRGNHDINVNNLFTWEDTVQGHEYWAKIHDKVKFMQHKKINGTGKDVPW